MSDDDIQNRILGKLVEIDSKLGSAIDSSNHKKVSIEITELKSDVNEIKRILKDISDFLR